jgi:hypothetical protein
MRVPLARQRSRPQRTQRQRMTLRRRAQRRSLGSGSCSGLWQDRSKQLDATEAGNRAAESGDGMAAGSGDSDAAESAKSSSAVSEPEDTDATSGSEAPEQHRRSGQPGPAANLAAEHAVFERTVTASRERQQAAPYVGGTGLTGLASADRPPVTGPAAARWYHSMALPLATRQHQQEPPPDRCRPLQLPPSRQKQI